MPGVIADPKSADKARQPTRNQQRRAKKKQQKVEASTTPAPEAQDAATPKDVPVEKPVVPSVSATDDSVKDEPDIADFDLPAEDPLFSQFKDIFAKFREGHEEGQPEVKAAEKPEVFYDDEDLIQSEDEEAETQKKLSKKARKKAKKLSIAELKAIVKRPETVDWTDISAEDPRLLVNIKGARNVVPVPNHWSLKREYLSSKRGIEKPGFALPKFIAETGISDMRDAVLEKQAEASLKQRQRERVQPKMGKLDIDYQKLYEAFFRRQTKPQLTRYGEVYFEGKEYETNLRHLRPGELSEELKEALNMPPGAPPPWLINQQRYGPPPNYPALKIAGLNAPPPPGAQWGFHAGGYGKPPLNDAGKALWGGDVFGVDDVEPTKEEQEEKSRAEAVDKSLWGELQPLEEDDEDEEEDEDDEEGDEDGEGREENIGTGLQTPFDGIDTPGGITSTIPTDFGGTHTSSEEFNLRKQRRGTDTEDTHHPRSAGTVLQERNIRAEGFFGGERAYDIKSGANRRAPDNVPMLGSEQAGRKRKVGDMDVSVDVDALERDDRLSRDEVRRRYEEQSARDNAGGWQGKVDQEDLSQMIAEESAKRQKRDAERRGGGRR